MRPSFLVILPRDAMHSADYAVARCLSVRLSVTRRYCVETAKRIKLFSPSGSHTILVLFRTKPYGNIPMGTSNAGGISETLRDRAIVTMEYQ